MSWNDRLRELRESLNYTQEQVAEMLEVDRVTVTGHESGRRKPNMKKLEKYAEIYHTTVDYIITDDNKEMFVKELIETMLNKGIIDDIDNMSEESVKMLIEAIKLDAKRIKKNINK